MKWSVVLTLFLLATAAFGDAPRLPLVEVPATARTSDTIAVMVSGDGGWAAIDRTIAAVMAENGIPVVGLNSLQYFWVRKTPESASHDLQSIIDRYLAHWQKSRVVLIGYSRGADVLPAMISRLPAATREKVALIALLGPSPKVEFEFHVADWLHNSSGGLPVKPEVDRLADRPVLCISGEDDPDSLCRQLGPPHVDVVILKGSHHFDGAYDRLARIILEHLK